MNENIKEKLMLIDGNSIINRGFYALPLLTDYKGRYTNGVYGFLNIIFKLIDKEKPDYICVAFDLKAKTFRHEMYQEYKGTRKSMPDELREQMPLLKELLQTMNVSICQMEGFEADDILGTMANIYDKQNIAPVIISGDRDLLQIASKTIKILIPKTKGGGSETYSYFEEDVIKEYGLTTTEFIDYKALMGDSSDNVPGVPSIGTKTASKIISQYKTVENAILNAKDIKPKKASENLQAFSEQAILSKELVTIKIDVPIDENDYSLENMSAKTMYNTNSYNLVKELGFKSHFARFSNGSGQNTQNIINDGFEEIEDDILDAPWDKENNTSTNTSKDSNSNLENIKNILEKNININVIKTEKESKEFFQNLTKTQTAYILIEDEYEEGKGKNSYTVKEVVGMCICQNENEITYIEVSPLNGFNDVSLLESSKEFFQNNQYVKIGYDIKKDMKILKDYINLNLTEENFNKHIHDFKKDFQKNNDAYLNSITENSFDTLIGAYILNPASSSYNYEEIAYNTIGATMPSYEDILGKGKKKLRFLNIDDSQRENFIARQCQVIYLAKNIMVEEFKKREQLPLYYNIDYPLTFVLNHMENVGIYVNKKALLEFQEVVSSKEQILQEEIINLAGEEFNVNSPMQLGEIIFGKLGLKGGKKTQRGYSTSVDVLEKLKGEHPIINKILEYRQISKLKSTYTDGLLAVINNEDNKIHSTFNQTVTATGRISSSEPNLQNIPIRLELGREVRKVFVPSLNNEKLFLDADYSQIELRILACIANDSILIDAFNNGEDIHALTASQVFGIPIEEVTSLQRSNAKAVNFGIIYGMGSFTLSQDLGITKGEADSYIHAYFNKYPNVKCYLDSVIENAKKDGYVSTLFNRRRDMPELKNSNYTVRNFGERVAMNMPIQGTSADIIKIAMIKVHRALKDFDADLILQVHDELLIEVSNNDADKVSKILVSMMEEAVDLAVKLSVDVHSGKSWFEAK